MHLRPPVRARELDQGPMSKGVRRPVRPWRRFLVVWLSLAALPATSHAQAVYTATAGMPVRIELVASCTVTATDLNFGAYASKLQTPLQGQSAIELFCGGPVRAEVSLDAGSG